MKIKAFFSLMLLILKAVNSEAQFKKGDKTKVKYKRANETKEAEIEF